MKLAYSLAAALALGCASLRAESPAKPDSEKPDAPKAAAADEAVFKPEEVVTTGSVAGIDYQAMAGTLVVHPKDWNDVKDPENKENPTAVASMFYVAYFKKGAQAQNRPVTFLYNGGPGSSTVWLHMGAFGPKRVVTANDTHTPAAPYQLTENEYTLLDASDLVFIDAPGTGFSRIAGKDAEKAFWGIDPDAYAFTDFIKQFLSKYGRWNSPKFLFGESYGTPRSAVVVNYLENNNGIDFNGVILLSQILNFGLGPDGAETSPGDDMPYVLALPTYAASAWYHHKLGGDQSASLQAVLADAEHFATTDYLMALQAGASLDAAKRTAIAESLHRYTGLPTAYILKANLRIEGGEFEKNLQDDEGLTTGRLDTRFSGPSLDPLSKEADYDPQASALSSAYISAFNDYTRRTLTYGQDKEYIADSGRVFEKWAFSHHLEGSDGDSFIGTPNVLGDLGIAMKCNTNLKVMLLGGYFDLATPFYQGKYEMGHLPIPQKLQDNISYHYYESGHMVYANLACLKQLHADVAEFIRANSRAGK